MDRATWWAPVHGVAESDEIECARMCVRAHTHTHTRTTYLQNRNRLIDLENKHGLGKRVGGIN